VKNTTRKAQALRNLAERPGTTAEGIVAAQKLQDLTGEVVIPAVVPETKAKPAKKVLSRSKAAVARDEAKKAKAAAKAAKKPAKRTKAAKPATEGTPKQPRDNTKTHAAIELIRSADGATLPKLMKKFGWQAHTVRGFIAGTLIKKLGLAVESFKNEAGERTYRIAV